MEKLQYTVTFTVHYGTKVLMLYRFFALALEVYSGVWIDKCIGEAISALRNIISSLQGDFLGSTLRISLQPQLRVYSALYASP